MLNSQYDRIITSGIVCMHDTRTAAAEITIYRGGGCVRMRHSHDYTGVFRRMRMRQVLDPGLTTCSNLQVRPSVDMGRHVSVPGVAW